MNEPTLYLSTRKKWRNWLARNHDREQEIWLIHYKKHTHRPSIPYNDAVEEALCFGWVDSLIRRIDSERYMQKYTPRKPKSTWSRHNVRRVEKMIKEGKMMPAGMDRYKYAQENRLLPVMEKQEGKVRGFPEAPGFFTRALRANPEAEKTFHSLAPSYKLQYLGWILDAKKEETRLKRMNEALKLLSEGRKLGLK